MAQSFKSVWTEADYAEMSWHDNHVHGIAIHAGQHGSGELEQGHAVFGHRGSSP